MAALLALLSLCHGRVLGFKTGEHLFRRNAFAAIEGIDCLLNATAEFLFRLGHAHALGQFARLVAPVADRFADDFARRRVAAGRDGALDVFDHLLGQGDGKLLDLGGHGGSPKSRTYSYFIPPRALRQPPHAAISFSFVAQSSAFLSARSKRSNSSPISASVMTSGGQKATRSPSSARTMRPSSSAKLHSVAATWRVPSKLCLVFLSATSSTAPIRPSPTASPTSGCSTRAFSRFWNRGATWRTWPTRSRR